jgi:hypothetical protein
MGLASCSEKRFVAAVKKDLLLTGRPFWAERLLVLQELGWLSD